MKNLDALYRPTFLSPSSHLYNQVYKTNTERLQKLDEQKHKIILQDGTEIPISHISEMNIIDPEIFE